MRTRRSPRNQERLWRDLGKQGQQSKPPPVPPAESLTAEQIKALPYGKADKTRMLKALEKEARRARVRAVLAQEKKS